MNPHLMLVRRTALALALLVTAIFSIAAQDKDQCNAVKVTLLQVNDVYQFAPVDQGARGGLARVLTLKKECEHREHALVEPQVADRMADGALVDEGDQTGEHDRDGVRRGDPGRRRGRPCSPGC